ncbi:DUF559 domain-containing protein [Candidatus Haliotispira prima]|uniref:site-specific DNA-methyltransferase (adenine-specific) n=1 Tax=Candidatus Haliotispira prima TaxID=3034016 RepID=A0ABY8MGG4_9SPIO|nr:DUF559 domain-containing protein [Candidatus Haliotispira prima]
MTIENYLDNINQRYQLGNATEHTFRGDLQQLIESVVPAIRATNEPKRQSCGAPDYILTRKDIPVGFIEAKDIGDKDLEGKKKSGNKEQFDRYKASLDNLIFTDYIDFHLYNAGEFVSKVAIAEITEKGIAPLPQNFAAFGNLIKDFCTHIGQNIKSSKELAEMMAGKARLLSDVIEKSLSSDETHNEDSTLKEQMAAFKSILIHDITARGFADVYAQTIAYGMFAARLHDKTLDTFSRQEAAELIPKSNPFLRKLFGYIAGPDIDDRIKWIVDNLAEIFLACNVQEILQNYGNTTGMEDPIIHFYETFLAEYDPALRKARGVWYTPAPVVRFIVRAVDDILKTEFGLPQGLADNSKTTISVETHTPDKRSATGYKPMEKEVHKVQILDPATGTGTFLAEVIKQVYKRFKGQEGIWSGYVENHLLPRLNGFELLMASYAMAHLQLDLLLKETGYMSTTLPGGHTSTTPPGGHPSTVQTGGRTSTTPPGGHPSKGGEFFPPGGRAFGGGEGRIRVYLTNSLEEYHPDTGSLFSGWLSSEANEANHIKRDTPVMCIIGNPPYSGESANKGEWIMGLMEDYKKEPGGKEKLKERNSKAINDDYVKFLRYGQHFIEKNGSGILAFINPHGFLDNPTYRGVRWNLLKTYDKIYTIDLHGNSKKKETAPDGSLDNNVFDIMQGVSINLFIKTGKKKTNELGKIYHHELFGKREFKYNYLSNNSFENIKYKEITKIKPNYFFVPKNFDDEKRYLKGFAVTDLFSFKSSGIKTHDDKNLVAINSKELENNLLRLNIKFDSSKVFKYSYRPFDTGVIYYDINLLGRARERTIYHLKYDNIGLILVAQPQAANLNYFDCLYLTNCLTDTNIYRRGGPSSFPLYLYPETNTQQTLDTLTGSASQQTTDSAPQRTPNLNQEIVNEIAGKLGLTFTPENHPALKGTPPQEGNLALRAAAPQEGSLNRETGDKQFPSSGGVVEDRGGQVPVENRGGHRDTENYMDLPYNPALKERAKELRKAGNLSEVLFWKQVKNKQFKGYDFDRQKIIGNYIVDFYCANCNVVVEIDGSSHENKQEYDAKRDVYLEGLGLVVIHITDVEVKTKLNSVMEMLRDHPALKGTPPKEGNFAPIDILDYVYAVLHSPRYRKKYREFLKIDFPRVPYPKDKDTFWKLVKLGGEIRQIHLLESPKVEEYITSYPKAGDNVITTSIGQKDWVLFDKEKQLGRIKINDWQYFDNIPLVAWEFYIGGYQPAQKWLKDRKGRTLDFDDILHYQKIIVALTETDRLMKEIDNVTE